MGAETELTAPMQHRTSSAAMRQLPELPPGRGGSTSSIASAGSEDGRASSASGGAAAAAVVAAAAAPARSLFDRLAARDGDDLSAIVKCGPREFPALLLCTTVLQWWLFCRLNARPRSSIQSPQAPLSMACASIPTASACRPLVCVARGDGFPQIFRCPELCVNISLARFLHPSGCEGLVLLASESADNRALIYDYGAVEIIAKAIRTHTAK